MASTIQKILNKLESPNYPFFGPNIKWLKFCGLILPRNKFMRATYIGFYAVLLGLFIFTQYIDIWMSRKDIVHLLQNTKYTMLSTIVEVKVITFLVWQKRWKSIIDFVTTIDSERHQSNDNIVQGVLKKYTRYCRTVTYLYWLIACFCTFMMIIQRIIETLVSVYTGDDIIYKDVVSSWTPWDKTTLGGYLISLIIQIIVVSYGVAGMIAFDINIFSILIFYHCELKLLKRDAKNIFGSEDSPATKEEGKIAIAWCHKRQNDILMFARVFNKCLSPILFLYVIVCSVMICSIAFQIKIETSKMEAFIAIVYLVFSVMQLFIYCWHSNEVFYASTNLQLGSYESIWWSRSLSEQKDINILNSQFSTPITFSAGPFTNITVATFVSIMKGAYSYYALLNQTN